MANLSRILIIPLNSGMNKQLTDEAYQIQILAGVSRTFALTIPQLPPALCKVVGNGYLLCRIADTIEDEPALTPEQKQHFSQQFINVVAGNTAPQTFSKALTPLLSAVMLEAEKELVHNTPRVINLTKNFNPEQQAALLRCVQVMAAGMADFQEQATLQGLKTVAEIDHYCYCVAGVVGEMLTTLFCDYSPQIAKNAKQLQKLSISFGQGLQMTNILKDIWEDQQRGACWLPQEVFTRFDFNLVDLSPTNHDMKFRSGLGELIIIAHQHLEKALRYVLLIPRREQGIRRFCLYALGMAVLTLRKINQQRDFTSGNQVKISRIQVKTVIILSNLLGYSNFGLRALFSLFTRKLRHANKS